MLNNTVYSLSMSSSIPEILELKVKNFPKSRQILDVFALTNFKKAVPPTLYPPYHAYLVARHVAKFHWATPPFPIVLNFKSIFKKL